MRALRRTVSWWREREREGERRRESGEQVVALIIYFIMAVDNDDANDYYRYCYNDDGGIY